MPRFSVLLLLGALLAATPAAAAEPACPLDVAACLDLFARMRERPWLGVEVETDSTGVPRVKTVVPGGPADQAGMKPGDLLERIGGQPPRDWFAGKSGWETSGQSACVVRRGGEAKDLRFTVRRMPDDLFARILGVHMVEGHLAHTESPGHEAR
jgi:hypothetical protein